MWPFAYEKDRGGRNEAWPLHLYNYRPIPGSLSGGPAPMPLTAPEVATANDPVGCPESVPMRVLERSRAARA